MSSFGVSSALALLHIFVVFFSDFAHAVNTEKPLQSERKAVGYATGQAIPVTCLNRTIDTGEHITDSQGQLQYIPFPVCNETNRPLELYFGVEKEINCTLPALPDPLFHLLEFYIHNDAPLTCRIPSIPLPTSSSFLTDHPYTPLQIALSGTLQLSHLHITPTLNLILHTSPSSASENPSGNEKQAEIIAASAYSIPSTASAQAQKLIIGDALPLRFSVRWYALRSLPPSTTVSSGLGGHVHISTAVYCVLGMGVGAAAMFVWWRGWELPRRLRKGQYGGEMGRGYAWPGQQGDSRGGYGNGWAATGKRD